jgi:CheY-like chemotaxis protein
MQIHILLIDDNKEYCKSLKSRFWNIGAENGLDIQVTDFQNLEEGFAELEKESKYKAIILDAKCLRIKEQETEDFQFLPEALDELEKINQRKGTYIPFVVNTGYYDTEVLSSLSLKIERQKGKVFDKSTQEEELLQHLLKEIASAENTKIEKQYSEIFEIFNKGFLDASLRNDLLIAIKKLDDQANVKNNFNPLRKFIEAIYKEIKAKDTSLIPDAVFYGRGGTGINLEWVWRYLSGMTVNVDRTTPPLQSAPLFPEHIGKNVKTVEELSSTISHYYAENVTTYAYKSAVFALLETLLWFKKLMEKP